jgi:excinuclease ABC subunit B
VVQEEYNRVHGITPTSIQKSMRTILEDITGREQGALGMLAAEEMSEYGTPKKIQAEIKKTKQRMLAAAGDLDFELAAELRDRMLILEKRELELR